MPAKNFLLDALSKMKINEGVIFDAHQLWYFITDKVEYDTSQIIWTRFFDHPGIILVKAY